MASRSNQEQLLVEADFFISLLTGDALSDSFRTVLNEGVAGSKTLLASSEVYDDVITAMRSQGIPLETVVSFVNNMRAIPHKSVAITSEVAITALNLYRDFGGSRKLHYFDSFHVATARNLGITMLTSDRFILENAFSLKVKVVDARRLAV